MNKKVVILLLLAVSCLLVPIVGGYIDFGSGADDQAGETVQAINPNYKPTEGIGGYEPTDAQEPWLFALQVAIGIGLFAWAYRAYTRSGSANDHQES